MVRGRTDKFPSERVTIMMMEVIDSLIKMDLAKDITKGAKEHSTKAASSYSKILNEAIAEEFAKGTDKKILRDAKDK